MVYDPDKHHRRSIRLREYDYARPGAYFVTICTHEPACLFGDVVDGVMQLNDTGRAVETHWNQIPVHFPRVELDAFMVMPNHVHGIIIFGDAGHGPVGAGLPRPYTHAALGNVVAYWKYQSTKHINESRGTPGIRIWQRGYYEHIIRNLRSLDRIRRYIADNPAQWAMDRDRPNHAANLPKPGNTRAD